MQILINLLARTRETTLWLDAYTYVERVARWRATRIARELAASLKEELRYELEFNRDSLRRIHAECPRNFLIILGTLTLRPWRLLR